MIFIYKENNMQIKLTGSQIDHMSTRVMKKLVKAYGDVVADMEERKRILDLLCLAQGPIMSLVNFTGNYGLKYDNTEYGMLHVILRHVSNTFFKITMKRYSVTFRHGDTSYKCASILAYALLGNHAVNENLNADLIEDLTNVALSLLRRLDLDIIEDSLVFGWSPDDTDLHNLINVEREPEYRHYVSYSTDTKDKLHRVVDDYLRDLKDLIDQQEYAILDRITDYNNSMNNNFFRFLINEYLDQVPTLQRVMKENEYLLTFTSRTPLLEMLKIITATKYHASKENDVYAKIATEVLELFKDLTYSTDYSVDDKVTIKVTIKGKEYLRTYSYDQLL